MASRITRLALCLALTACQNPLPPAPTPAPQGPLYPGTQTVVGAQTHFLCAGPSAFQTAVITNLAALPIRADRDGAEIQYTPTPAPSKTHPPYDWNFAQCEAYYGALQKAGMTGPHILIFSSYAASKWVGQPTPTMVGTYDGELLCDLGSRGYNVIGEDHNEVDAQNATNENEVPSFGPGPNGYTSYGIPELQALRKVCPTATVLTGSSASPNVKLAQWLAQSGILAYTNGVAMHEYGPLCGESLDPDVRAEAAALPSSQQIFATEYGEPGQADLACRVKTARSEGLPVYILYEAASCENCEDPPGWALLDDKGNPTPQYSLAKQAITQ